MTISIALGRAASYLEHFGAGLCLTLVATAFLHAAAAQARAAIEPEPVVCTADC